MTGGTSIASDIDAMSSRPVRLPDGLAGFRVLYVWDADYPWDVRVEKVCLALRDAGADVHIVARNKRRAPLVEALPEGTVHRMPAWKRFARLDSALGAPAFFNPRWIRLLASVTREVRPDVIIVRDVPLCPTAIWIGRMHGIPVIHDMAEHYPAMIREVFAAKKQQAIDHLLKNPAGVALVERYCIRAADATIVVIEEMAERLRDMGLPEDRVTLVSNTPPAARAVAPRPRAPADDTAPLRLVYLGIMEIPRGIDDLIDAAALLRDGGTRVQVDLVGTGRDMSEFEERARARGVFGNEVRFHGFVKSHSEALAIVARADVGVLPHRRCEHWDHTIPNKLFDYMAVGLPVLTSDARPFARIVRESEVGEVVSSHSPAALADAVRRLADPALRARYGENGRIAVQRHYNWERDSARLIEMVARVARVRTPRGS